MNKIFAVIFFPIFWISMYLYRIVVCDCFGSLYQIILNLLTNTLYGLWLLIRQPIAIIIDIPLGFFVTMVFAFRGCVEMWTGEIDFASAIKCIFTKR